MVTKHKLVVKKLPRKVCISIRAGKGRTLAKTTRRRKGKRIYSRKRKVKGGSIKRCSKVRSQKVCRRLAARKCLTKKGTLKKSKMCRSLARTRGLRKKAYRRRKASPLSSSGVFFGKTLRQLGIPTL